ncbi:peptidylprolyl isomerase [Robiginitalea sp.]|jgi:peptidyl-prolyl cis-trans isomerase B (cyclophilin B)|uniref:peptidylprolyl isomerase n=1 Tax=Robiginitalea sp. TaxID=1902411 RepID=UPI003C72DE37
MKGIIYPGMLLCFLCIFGFESSKGPKDQEAPVKVKLVTTHGEIVLKLYDETPLHRDNFIKIIRDSVLDGVLFHRVIEEFMIQGGDTDSKYAQRGDTLGSADLPYSVEAEIRPELFHKKGVIGAARGNTPDRVSSSSQFYIVQGKILNDSLLDRAETRINGWLAEYYIKREPEYRAKLDSLKTAIEVEDMDTFAKLNTEFEALAKEYKGFETYKIPEAHREVYRTLGGTPHLDQNYTVFGEVVSGLSVVDTIAGVDTDSMDRPMLDVRILKAEVLK